MDYQRELPSRCHRGYRYQQKQGWCQVHQPSCSGGRYSYCYSSHWILLSAIENRNKQNCEETAVKDNYQERVWMRALSGQAKYWPLTMGKPIIWMTTKIWLALAPMPVCSSFFSAPVRPILGGRFLRQNLAASGQQPNMPQVLNGARLFPSLKMYKSAAKQLLVFRNIVYQLP